MLSTYIVSFNFYKSVQSGLYMDFLLKQFCEIFIRNFFIYTPLFFGEKFLIEYFTKKLVDTFIFKLNTVINYLELDYSYFFINIISFFLYLLSAINLLYFLF